MFHRHKHKSLSARQLFVHAHIPTAKSPIGHSKPYTNRGHSKKCIPMEFLVFCHLSIASSGLPLVVSQREHRDLDNSVFVSLSRELFCFDYVLYSLSYAGSCDLVSQQWPAVHNQNKQRFLNETFKTRCCNRLKFRTFEFVGNLRYNLKW